MNAEELTQPQATSGEMKFDAHEFDGLRDEFALKAENWLKRADQLVQENPWLCIAVAAAAGVALGAIVRNVCSSDTPAADKS